MHPDLSPRSNRAADSGNPTVPASVRLVGCCKAISFQPAQVRRRWCRLSPPMPQDFVRDTNDQKTTHQDTLSYSSSTSMRGERRPRDDSDIDSSPSFDSPALGSWHSLHLHQ